MSLKKLFSIAVLLLFFNQCFAYTLDGRVVWVVDGDTVHVRDKSQKLHKVRLSGINAPEKKRAFSNKAKRYLISLVYDTRVRVYWQKRDKYGRILGKIITAGRDINLAMVRGGYARWYRRYAAEQSKVDRVLYRHAEQRAKNERRGIWRYRGL